MTLEQEPGIRTRIWLAGRFAMRDPVPLQLATQRFEARTRTSNLALRVDRPALQIGTFSLPNIRTRHSLTLPWATVQENDLIEHIDLLAAKGQPFDLGIWKHVYDVFDGDGTTTTFYLQRRQLLPNVTPPTEFPSYPTRVTTYDMPYGTAGATATEYTVTQTPLVSMGGTPGTGEAMVEEEGHQVGRLWVSELKLNPAPPNVHDSLVVSYMPLYSVVIEEENPRSYSAGMVEPRSYKLSEYG